MSENSHWPTKLKLEVEALRENLDWSNSLDKRGEVYVMIDGPTRRFDTLCLIVLSMLEHLAEDLAEKR